MSGDTRRTRSRNKNAGGRNSSDGDAKRNGVDVVMKNGKSTEKTHPLKRTKFD